MGRKDPRGGQLGEVRHLVVNIDLKLKEGHQVMGARLEEGVV